MIETKIEITETVGNNEELPEITPKEDATEEVIAEPTTPITVVEELQSENNSFTEQWNKMFDIIFKDIATVYYPLKGLIPHFENQIITVTVKNDIQKNDFKSHIPSAIDYLCQNFQLKVETINVVVNNEMEGKKIIYDIKDKMQNLQEQNAELTEFLNILQLKPKEY